MHVVFDKIPIDNCWTVVDVLRHKQESTATHLSQMILQKCSKRRHSFAYNGLPDGLLRRVLNS